MLSIFQEASTMNQIVRSAGEIMGVGKTSKAASGFAQEVKERPATVSDHPTTDKDGKSGKETGSPISKVGVPRVPRG